jgi:hypothetical protein
VIFIYALMRYLATSVDAIAFSFYDDASKELVSDHISQGRPAHSSPIRAA